MCNGNVVYLFCHAVVTFENTANTKIAHRVDFSHQLVEEEEMCNRRRSLTDFVVPFLAPTTDNTSRSKNAVLVPYPHPLSSNVDNNKIRRKKEREIIIIDSVFFSFFLVAVASAILLDY